MAPRSLKFLTLFLLLVSLVYGFTSNFVASSGEMVSAQSPDVDLPDDVLDTIEVVILGLTTVEVNKEVEYSASTGISAAGFTFIWSFGDGTSQQKVGDGSVKHTYSTTGFKTITLIVTNGVDSGRNSITVEVTDVPTPLPPPMVAPDGVSARVDAPQDPNGVYVVAPNTAITIIANVERGSPLNYVWSIGDQVLLRTSNDPVLIHQFTEAGTHTIDLLVWNDLGSRRTMIDFRVTAEPISGLALIPPFPIIENQRAVFRATVKTGTDVLYFFEFGDGNTSGGFSSSPIAENQFEWHEESTNEYNVKVKATNNATTNPVEVSRCIAVSPKPVDHLELVNSGPADPPDGTVILSTALLEGSGIDANANVENYGWKFTTNWALDDSSVPGQAGINVIDRIQKPGQLVLKPRKANIVDITYVRTISPAFNPEGCGQSAVSRTYHAVAASMVIAGEPAPFPGAFLTIDGHLLASETAHFDFPFFQAQKSQSLTLQINGLGADNYLWDFGDGTEPPNSTDSVEHAYEKDGVYLIKVTTPTEESVRAYYAVVKISDSRLFAPLITGGGGFNVQSLPTLIPLPSPTISSRSISNTSTPTPTNTPTPMPTDTPTVTPTEGPTLVPTSTSTPVTGTANLPPPGN